MTVDLTKGNGTEAPPPRKADARLRRRSRSAVARSTGGDRWLAVLIGLVLLAAGVGVTLLSYGVFGTGRAARPLLDPIIVAAVVADPLLWRMVAIVGGILLAILGLAWVARSVRPEPHPDVTLPGGPETTILVSSAAAGEAVAAQAGALPGVGRARARLVGSATAPALRVTLWLADDADVRAVLRRLDEEVLATARTALELPVLPVAVRLELARAQPTPRVA
ncbi:MAG TPA: alkaline shock response membrane anchor protein AmaP [Pseudonocardia sp.]